MRKIALVVTLAFSAAACGTLPNPVTKDRLSAIKAGYGITLAGAVAYHDACAKRLIASSCRLVVPRLQSADARVRIALDRLGQVVKLGTEVSYLQALDVLSDAVNEFKVIASENGVR